MTRSSGWTDRDERVFVRDESPVVSLADVGKDMVLLVVRFHPSKGDRVADFEMHREVLVIDGLSGNREPRIQGCESDRFSGAVHAVNRAVFPALGHQHSNRRFFDADNFAYPIAVGRLGVRRHQQGHR